MVSAKWVRATIFGVSAIALSSCATLTDRFVAPTLGPEPYHSAQIEDALTAGETALIGDRHIDTGIALSGGGLRSAYYTIGALKALYDGGVLGGRADMISTVSGGSYAAYWVYTNQYDALSRAPASSRFGSASFDEKVFYRHMCQRLGDANFVKYGPMLRSTVSGNARTLYDERLGVVFGPTDRVEGNPREGRLRIDALAAPIARRGWPYLIVNATRFRPRPDGWNNALFEITPVGTRGHAGDERTAAVERPWVGGDAVKYRYAVAASGAAFATLLHRGMTLRNGDGSTSEIRIADGGGSENLGAIALIRRGVPHIIIIDAEHDPDYRFGAYTNLKKRLAFWGASIVIDGIETHLAKEGKPASPDVGNFTGKAVIVGADGKPRTLRIDYLKMSLPEPLKAGLRADHHAGTGKASYDSFFDAMGSLDATGHYDCTKAAAATDPLLPWFRYGVAHYGQWWNATRRARKIAPIRFPQYTTFDQSMFKDQALAFIGLGYIQGREYVTDPRNSAVNPPR